MQRRHFNAGVALALSLTVPRARAAKHSASMTDSAAAVSAWAAIEREVGGRLGVAVLDTATGRTVGHRLDERFPMCSTFKWLASALVLHRADIGLEQLTRRVHYRADQLIDYSPMTEKHADKDGMTMAELCEAAITVSDNTAGNLLLESFGGPASLTRYARTLGDPATRLDRIEPQLNESLPGDVRDTTTPRAMSIALRAATIGDSLSVEGRGQLIRWMLDTTTGGERLRAGVPPGWRVADKTGTGQRGSTNDVAVMWPPDRAPLIVAAYLTQCKAAASRRNAALADAARAIRALHGVAS